MSQYKQVYNISSYTLVKKKKINENRYFILTEKVNDNGMSWVNSNDMLQFFYYFSVQLQAQTCQLCDYFTVNII